MSGPWDNVDTGEDVAVPANYFAKEKDLSLQVSGPNLARETEEQELKPWAMNGLDEAIAQAKSPWEKEALVQTKQEHLDRREKAAAQPEDGPWNKVEAEKGPWDNVATSQPVDYPDQVSRTATHHPTGMWDKYVEQPLGKLDNSSPTAYFNSRAEAIGGAAKGFAEAGVSGLGMASSLLGSAMGPDTGTKMKDALATGEKWAHALSSFLPEQMQKELDSPSAQAGVQLSSIPLAPLLEGIDALRNAGHEDLADAATLALGIGGTAAMGAGFRGKGKAKAAPEVKPDISTEKSVVDSMVGKGKEEGIKTEGGMEQWNYTKPEKAELTASSEYDLSQPPKSATYGEYAAPTQEPVGHPQYEGGIDYYPENPTKAADAVKEAEVNKAWEEHAAAQEKDNTAYAEQVKPYMEGELEPSQGSRILEKGPTRVANNRGRNRQSGVIDPELLGVNAVMNIAAKLKKVFSNPTEAADFLLDRYRGTFSPEQIDILKSRKSQVMMMSPDEFHNLAARRGPEDAFGGKGRRMQVEDHLNTLNGLNEYVELRMAMDPDTGEIMVVGHNGRHRMDILKAKGVELVPVLIKMEDRSFFKPSDILNSKKSTIVSENGERVPKPKSLASLITETTKPKSKEVYNMGNRVRLEGGEMGTVVGKTEGQVQVRLNDGTSRFVQPEDIVSKSMVGGVGTKGFRQGGAVLLPFGELFSKKKATAADFAYDGETMRELITKAIMHSDNYPGFVEALKLEQNGPIWMRDVVGRAEELWANKQRIIADLPPSLYSKLDKTSQKQTADTRPYEVFEKETLPHNEDGSLAPIPEGQDIGKVGLEVNTATQASVSNYNSMGGKWMKWIISNAQEISNKGAKLFDEMKSMVEGFDKISTPSKRRITTAATKFDGILNDKLKEAGLQWPTRDMLKEVGLDDKEIAAYESEMRAVDRGWEILEQGHRDMGKEPPPRIPGYFPRFWEGSWKVKVFDEAGNLREIRPFDNKYTAQMWGSKGLEDGYTTKLIKPETEVKQLNFVASMQDMAEVYAGKSALGKAMVNMLAKMDESATRGMITEALERDANAKGYMGEHGTKPLVPNIFNFIHNAKLMSAYVRYFEDISKFWANSHIAREVAAPFMDAVQQGHFKDAPNTKAAINRFISRATGHPINRWSGLESANRSAAVAMGLPPDTIGISVRGSSKLMQTVFLKYNPIFWGLNLVQPMMVWPKLIQLHMAQVLDKKATSGSLIKSFSKSIEQFALYDVDRLLDASNAETKRVIQWGHDNGVIETLQSDHIDPMKSSTGVQKLYPNRRADQIMRYIEKRGRTVSLLALHTYFKDTGMSDLQALQAAALHTDEVMGSYKDINVPGMYTDYGTSGQSIRPFAILVNTYLGNQISAMTFAKDHFVKAAKDPRATPAALASLIPLAAYMGFFYTSGGIPAMFGTKEYDTFAKVFNSFFPESNPMKESGDYLREHDFPEHAKYGFLGSNLGINIGPSIGSPAFSALGNAPVLQVGKTLIELVYEATKYATEGPEGVNFERVRSATSGIMHPNLKPVLDRMFSAREGLVPEANSLNATVMRTPKEESTYLWTGKKAITEVERDTEDKIYKRESMNHAQRKQDIVSKIVTGETLPKLQVDVAKLYQKALDPSNEYGFDANSLTEAINAERQRRIIEKKTRDLQAVEKSNNPAEQSWRLKQLMH